MEHIDIAEAKLQIERISDKLEEPLLLIGGIAINQYDVTRQSQDIDLICDHNTATSLVKKLYPTTSWTRTEIHNDEYRPSYHIKHKHNEEYPIIKIGPKIIERGAYKYLDWEKLKEGAIPFSYKDKKLKNILVPSIEALCYSKIVSFIGRIIENKDKLNQDLQDICELANNDSFRLGILLNLIASNGFEVEMDENFQKRLNFLGNSIEKSNIGKIIQLFSMNTDTNYNASNNKHTVLQPRPSLVKVENKIKLAAFDLDGTLIKGLRHSWTLVWKHLKVDNKIQKQRKEDFRNNKLSYLDWCRLDGEAFIKHGLKKDHFEAIVKDHGLNITKNLREGLKILKENGIKTAIISGGIDTLLYTLLPEADDLFDEILINRFLYSDNNELATISATEYDWDDSKIGVVGKRRGLERICEKFDISTKDAAFVGDDLNDIEAMKSAGLDIFYCGDSREFFDKERLPTDIVIIPENNFLKVVDRILYPPTGEQIE